MSEKPKEITPMNEKDKERIMSADGKKNDGEVSEWVSRVQSAADKNENAKKKEESGQK